MGSTIPLTLCGVPNSCASSSHPDCVSAVYQFSGSMPSPGGSLRTMDFIVCPSPAAGAPVPSSAVSMRLAPSSNSPSYNLSCSFVLDSDTSVSTRSGSTAMLESSALLLAMRKYPCAGMMPERIVNINTSPSSLSLVMFHPAKSMSASVVFCNSIHSWLFPAKSPIHISSLNMTSPGFAAYAEIHNTIEITREIITDFIC